MEIGRPGRQASEQGAAPDHSTLIQFQGQPVRVREEGETPRGELVDPDRLDGDSLAFQLRYGRVEVRHLERQMPQAARLGIAGTHRRIREREDLELDPVGILEREHVDAKRAKAGDLAVHHALLLEKPLRKLQVVAAGDTEAEMVKADAVRVELANVTAKRVHALSWKPAGPSGDR